MAINSVSGMDWDLMSSLYKASSRGDTNTVSKLTGMDFSKLDKTNASESAEKIASATGTAKTELSQLDKNIAARRASNTESVFSREDIDELLKQHQAQTQQFVAGMMSQASSISLGAGRAAYEQMSTVLSSVYQSTGMSSIFNHMSQDQLKAAAESIVSQYA